MIEQGKMTTYFIIGTLGKVNEIMLLDPMVRKFSILLETPCALKAALMLLSCWDFATKRRWRGYDLRCSPLAAGANVHARDSNVLISRKCGQ